MEKVILGLDIGTNSVGSAWVDLENQEISLGCSIFPAGIEESEQKRGAPKNQARRSFRQRRRNTDRKADRKHAMWAFLISKGWMPTDKEERDNWLQMNPWLLRKEGLERQLTPYEFGRILLHMCERRGAWGFGVSEEESSPNNKEEREEQSDQKKKEQKIKAAIEKTKEEMRKGDYQTFGQFMASKYYERKEEIEKREKKKECRRFIGLPIRNRKTADGQYTYEFCADREMVWHEFDLLWN